MRLLLLALVLACSLGPALADASARSAKSDRVVKSHRVVHSEAFAAHGVKFAKKLLGVPYRWGGSSPRSGFDCSGLVSFVYRHFGIEVPHSSYGQFALGKKVPRRALHPGDLVFFDGVGHVGMYVGRGRFIHALHSGTRVQISKLSESWYRSRYDGARRLVRVAAKAPRANRRSVHTTWDPFSRFAHRPA
jgi:cell wall-associated NlpC family hydrolase